MYIFVALLTLVGWKFLIAVPETKLLYSSITMLYNMYMYTICYFMLLYVTILLITINYVTIYVNIIYYILLYTLG